MSGGEVVRAFFEAIEARDWGRAGAFLAEDLEVDWPGTGERFTGPRFLAMQRAYPEGWQITVLEVLGDARAAARVRVDHGDAVFLSAGFYDVSGGRITRAVEHWVELGGERPPTWRSPYAEGGPLSLALQRRP
jgi:ketosteroid isomerase-like protein